MEQFSPNDIDLTLDSIAKIYGADGYKKLPIKFNGFDVFALTYPKGYRGGIAKIIIDDSDGYRFASPTEVDEIFTMLYGK